MAISTQQKRRLRGAVGTTTAEFICKLLKVSPSWVSKNKKGLEDLGIHLIRKEHKPHKPHKPHKKHKTHRNKGLSHEATLEKAESIDMRDATNYKFKNYIILKVLANEILSNNSLPKLVEIHENTDLQEVVKRKFYTEFYKDGQLMLDPLRKYLRDILDFYLEPAKSEYETIFEMMNTATKSVPNYMPPDAKYCLFSLKYFLDSMQYVKPVPILPRYRDELLEAFSHVMGDSIKPTEEQLQCLHKMRGFGMNLFATEYKTASIQADAGVSKTTIALVAQHLLKDYDPYITAVTNKALNRKGKCMTIHSLLKTYTGVDNIRDDFHTKIMQCEHKKDCLDLLIVDEASQVNFETRYMLETIAKKIIYIGDIKQLPPINGVRGIERVFLHTLTEQFRFKDSEDDFSQEYTKANKLLDYARMDELLQPKIIGNCYTTSKEVRVQRKIVDLFDFSDTFTPYLDIIKQYTSDDHQVVAYTNQCVDALNEILNEGSEIKIGSKIILTVNDYEHEQYNGFQYRVKDIITRKRTKYYVCTSIETGETYEFKKNQIALGFCITTTKSRGSAFKHLLGIINTSPVNFLVDTYVIGTRQELSIRFLKVYNKAQGLQSIFDKLFQTEDKQEALVEVVKELNQTLLLNEDTYEKLRDIVISVGLSAASLDSMVEELKENG